MLRVSTVFLTRRGRRTLPRVLIVDDEPGIRFALRRWFERQQWSVLDAEDGQAALDLLFSSSDASDARIDICICDLHLPNITGEAVVRALGEERPELVARVLLTTGDAVLDADQGSVLANHPHVLQKPFDLATLKRAIEKIVGP
jgi:CheY-like chemotaxis protein